MENIIIGQLLRSTRESKNLSIEEVSLKTKINLNILKNLEANKLDQLPNKTYVRGFAKTYGKLVGIKAETILHCLDFTYGDLPSQQIVEEEAIDHVSTEEDEKSLEKRKQVEAEEIQDNLKSIFSSFINKKVLILFGAIIVGIFIIKSISAFFTQISNEQVKIVKEEKINEKEINEPKPQTETSVKEETVAEKLKQEELAKIQAQKEAELAAAEKAKQEELARIQAKKEAEEKAKIESTPEGKYPKIEFFPAPKDMYSIVIDAPENTNTDILPLRFKNAALPDKQNVYIRAYSGDTWVSYQADEDKIKRFVLKEGRSVLIKGDKILLFMGNVKAAKIFYNNQLIKTPSKSGVKSLIFPEELASEYELPLFPSYKGIPIKAEVYKANMAK